MQVIFINGPSPHFPLQREPAGAAQSGQSHLMPAQKDQVATTVVAVPLPVRTLALLFFQMFQAHIERRQGFDA
jgi:hypothetical protein